MPSPELNLVVRPLENRETNVPNLRENPLGSKRQVVRNLLLES